MSPQELIETIEQMTDEELEQLAKALSRHTILARELATQPVYGGEISLVDVISWSGLGPY